ncbi:MAG: aminoacyl-tRNA hydrolase [Spirochaetaceae bacterium]|jgi:PTH1 family peptidyl-tRNA hydrolase|nr:aminoacyl-tRNA hydrolase [Spirochaetaceae bacterium]
MISLAVFLGNPGAQYALNRHNAGRLLAEKLPFYTSLHWQKKFKGLFSANTPDDGMIRYFLMPETYMNLSGSSVRSAASFYKIKSGEIIVIHDELELPLGTVSLKYAGGLGGHNGLRSIRKELGTADFWRLRVGIGRPPAASEPAVPGEIAQWVLEDFDPAEKPALEAALDAGAALLVRVLAEEPEPLLAEWKKKTIDLFKH